MGIYHAAFKVKSERGYASEWNAAHVVEDVDKPKVPVTFVVAAADSVDTSRADYVCDAATAQDAINEALADLPAAGGAVQLLEGTFQITASIAIPAANVELRGLGYGTKIQTTSDVTMIYNNAHHHVAIRDLHIYGAGAGNNSNYGIRVTNSDYVTITGCYITNTGNDGIYTLTSVDYFRAMRNLITSCFAHGMRLADVHEGDISHNIVIKNRYNGIFLQNGINDIVSGNNCSENDSADTSTYDGINLSGSSWNIITGNRCHENDGYEINIWDAGCQINLVHGNHARGGGHVGAINDAGTGTVLADNVVA